MPKNTKAEKANKKPNKPKNSTVEQRASKAQAATIAIEAVKRTIERLRPIELSASNRLHTFQSMLYDDAVFTCFDYNTVLIEKSFSSHRVEYNIHSENSKKAKDFIEWNLNHLDKQTLRSISRSMAEFKRDGLAPMEKVLERSSGVWENTPSGIPAWKLKKLNYIHPLTLHPSEPFTIEGQGNKITYMNQSSSAFQDSGGANNLNKGLSKGYKSISINKISLVTYSGTDAQPFGKSPFEACYTAWREKVLLQDLVSVGVSKDLSGTPILTIPSNILNDAAADPASAAGIMVESLKESLANMHAGDQASMMMPSDTFNEAGSGAKEFDIKFLGVEGGGKNFALEQLIDQKKRAIYSVWGATQLLSAESAGGYNAIEGQVNIHKHYIDRDIAVIEEVWNKDILPQLFRMNEWEISDEDMPKLRAGEIDPVTIEEYSKGIQRVGAVGLIPRVAPVINEILQGIGIKYQVDENMSQEELDMILTDATSRSGDGMSSGLPSGVGKSTGNNSATNSDNKA